MLISLISYTKEHISKVPRAAILLVQAFCIRLHDEDPTFIRHFIQRHLRLKAVYKEPHHLQETSLSGVSLTLLSTNYPRPPTSLPHAL
jgi:hypothetical protein